MHVARPDAQNARAHDCFPFPASLSSLLSVVRPCRTLCSLQAAASSYYYALTALALSFTVSLAFARSKGQKDKDCSAAVGGCFEGLCRYIVRKIGCDMSFSKVPPEGRYMILPHCENG